MGNEILYMTGVVAVGFLVNYSLRALPFLLFAGRDRALPSWVDRFGKLLSPVIIGGLIVYSYSGLEWRTAWPYLAGALTVALHLWKRNALASIVAGTVLYMALVNCGCSTRRTLELDARHPAVRMTASGCYFGDEPVRPEEVPEILHDYDVPHDRVIHILLDKDVKDLRPARTVMGYLGRAGYTRPVLVTERHAEAVSLGKKKPTPVKTSSAPRKSAPKQIRYKKAAE